MSYVPERTKIENINLSLLTDISSWFEDDVMEGNVENFFPIHDNDVNDIGDGDDHDNGLQKFVVGNWQGNLCGDRFWLNYFTNECMPVKCSMGRNLTLEDHDGRQPRCRLVNGASNQREVLPYMYMLDLLWYGDTLNDSTHHQDDLETIGLDEFYKDMHDNHGYSSNKPPALCNMFGKLEEQLSHHEDKSKRGNNGAASSLPPKSQVFPHSLYHNLLTHETLKANMTGRNGTGNVDFLKISLINETIFRLRKLNISPILTKIWFPKFTLNPLSGSKTNFRLPNSNRLIAYFPVTLSENQSNFEAELVNRFSEKVNITLNGALYTFHSVMLKNGNNSNLFLDRNQTFKYFISKEIRHANECCYEISQKALSIIMSTFTCQSKKPILRNIHLASTCPYVGFNTSDFNMTTGQTIAHKRFGLRLARHQYLVSGSKLIVCLPVLETLQGYLRHRWSNLNGLRWWESLLTLTFLPLSMFCLLVTFVTYCMFPNLRTIPGKNNMFLVFWLFWAQTFIISNAFIQDRNSLMCVVMGIILHYSWLVTMMWTCICSFHMFSVFVIYRGKPVKYRSHAWYLVYYSICSHFVPALIVITVGIVSTYTTDSQSIGYGGVVCYLNSKVLVGLSFLLPLSLILVINMFFFFSTVFVIARIEKIKRQIGPEAKNTYTYAKLSSLTSLTWILDLIAKIPGCEALRLASVAVNASQGIFIFFSYTANRRVQKLWTGRKVDRRNGIFQSYDTSTRVTFKSTSSHV